MKRSYSLRIERLEDRCVPAVLTDTTTALVDPSSTTYVIDPYLIDPNAAPTPTKTTTDGWTTPDQPTQPIADPLNP